MHLEIYFCSSAKLKDSNILRPSRLFAVSEGLFSCPPMSVCSEARRQYIIFLTLCNCG